MSALARRPVAAPAPAAPHTEAPAPRPNRMPRGLAWGTQGVMEGVSNLVDHGAKGVHGAGLVSGGFSVFEEVIGQLADQGEIDLGDVVAGTGIDLAADGAKDWLTQAAVNPLTRRWGVDLLADPKVAAGTAAGKIGMGLAGAAGGALSGGLMSVWENYHQLQAGTIDRAGALADVAVDTGVGAWTGLGSGLGAALGTALCPGVGTALGGALGGMAAGALAEYSGVADTARASLTTALRPSTPGATPRRESPRAANRPAW